MKKVFFCVLLSLFFVGKSSFAMEEGSHPFKNEAKVEWRVVQSSASTRRQELKDEHSFEPVCGYHHEYDQNEIQAHFKSVLLNVEAMLEHGASKEKIEEYARTQTEVNLIKLADANGSTALVEALVKMGFQRETIKKAN